MNTRVRSGVSVVALVAFTAVGCSTWENMGNRERGAVIGAGGGAGRGESEPIASNDDEAGRAENRRVEVAIFASEDLQDEARAAASRN